MEFLRKIGSYIFFFRKQETPEGQNQNFNLRTMHFINKLSLAMFIVAVIIMAVRFFTRG